MTESKKKKTETAADPAKNLDNMPLSQLFLDRKTDKYRIVTLAIRWAQEIKKREPNSPDTPTKLLEKSLREILTDHVALEDIEKLPPLPKVERKSDESRMSDFKINLSEKEKAEAKLG